jgi:tetratricopeptide (TPR) repeat protein
VALKPDAAIYRRELGVALYKAGKLQSAHQELDRALALDSRAAQTYYWRARVLAGLGNQQGAIADLETVLALQPSITSAYSELGELYSRTGQPQKAQEVLAKQKGVQEATSADDRDRLLLELSDPLL